MRKFPSPAAVRVRACYVVLRNLERMAISKCHPPYQYLLPLLLHPRKFTHMPLCTQPRELVNKMGCLMPPPTPPLPGRLASSLYWSVWPHQCISEALKPAADGGEKLEREGLGLYCCFPPPPPGLAPKNSGETREDGSLEATLTIAGIP